MLVDKISNQIEIHQVKYGKFSVMFNGHVVQTSQDLDSLTEWANANTKEIAKRGQQVAKLAKVQQQNQTRVEKAQAMSRNEFIASELITKTKKSNNDKLVQRKNGNFDICFMNIPTWSNITIDDIEIWTGRSGMSEMSREASRFWMEAN